MLEDSLYIIELKKNAGALEEDSQHMRVKNKLWALMREAGRKILELGLKGFIQNMATYTKIKHRPILTLKVFITVQNGGQRS